MQINNIQATFTRPANTNAYAAGQLIANATSAGAVVPMAFALGNSFGPGQFRLTRIRIFKSGTMITNASFRLHLYEKQPTCASGDGAAWLTDSSAHWLGNIDMPSMLPFSDGAAGTGSAVAGSELYVRMFAGSTLYGLLMALAPYTPGAGEQFTTVLEELDAY